MYGSPSGLFAAIEIAPFPAGLVYRSGLLNECEESEIVRWIDAQPWDCGLARRVQHYGWRYDYRARAVFAEDRLGPLPGPLRELADRLLDAGLVTERFDQAIINEYLPGQGIAAHVDCEPCFGEEIAMVSLLDSCPMEFVDLGGCAVAPVLDEFLPPSPPPRLLRDKLCGQGGDKSCAIAPVLDERPLSPTPLPSGRGALAWVLKSLRFGWNGDRPVCCRVRCGMSGRMGLLSGGRTWWWAVVVGCGGDGFL